MHFEAAAGSSIWRRSSRRSPAVHARYLLCHPHNPTGRSFLASRSRGRRELAARYGVTVIADEVHCAASTLPGRVARPLPHGRRRRRATGLAIVSASKAWNLAGLKCALIVAGSETMHERLDDAPSGAFPYHAGHLGVLASLAAFEHGGEWLDALVRTPRPQPGELLGELLAERKLPGRGLRAARGRLPRLARLPPLELGDDPAAVFLERGRVALSAGPARSASRARASRGSTSAPRRRCSSRRSSAWPRPSDASSRAGLSPRAF